MPPRAFGTFEPRDGRGAGVRQIDARKIHPVRTPAHEPESPRTEVVVAKPLVDDVCLRAPPVDAAERAAAQRATFAMQAGDADWPAVLAATLPTLSTADDCIRLVFLDGSGARRLLGEPWSSDVWLPHSVVLFGDGRPVRLAGKRLPLGAWMQRTHFLEVSAGFRLDGEEEEEDAEDLARFRQASAEMPWAPALALPVVRGHRRLEEAPHDTFLDFLDFALEEESGFAERFVDVRLFSSVRLRGGCYEGGLVADVGRGKERVFVF